jgi:hypothetical protein
MQPCGVLWGWCHHPATLALLGVPEAVPSPLPTSSRQLAGPHTVSAGKTHQVRQGRGRMLTGERK